MRTIAIAFAFGLAVLATGSASAAEKAAVGVLNAPVLSGGVFATTGSGGINTANQAAPVSGGFSPLTAAECRGLGGKLVPHTACALNFGTEACVTVDADGVVRKLCLTK